MRSRGLSPHYRGTRCFLERVLSLSSPCAQMLRTQADSRRAHGARYAPPAPNATGPSSDRFAVAAPQTRLYALPLRSGPMRRHPRECNGSPVRLFSRVPQRDRSALKGLGYGDIFPQFRLKG